MKTNKQKFKLKEKWTMEINERICRICLKSETHQEFTKIHSNNNEIALNLRLVSGIAIDEFTDSNTPALICEACLKELYQCLQFRVKCLSADEFFKTKSKRAAHADEIKLEFLDTVSNEADFDSITYEVSTESQFKPDGNELEKDEVIESIPEPLPQSVPTLRRRSKPVVKSKEKLKNSLECSYCGVVLSRRNRRIEHERLHFIDETQQFYICCYCGKSFNQKFGLIPHFIKCHDFRPGPREKWKCAICPNKILPPGNMAFHYDKCHNNFTFSSKPDTNSKVSNIKGTKKSKKKPAQAKPSPNFWPCSICGNSFSNHYRYLKHLKQAHDLTSSQLIHHENATIKNVMAKSENDSLQTFEMKPPKFPCSTCGKVFASLMTVRAHEKTHLNFEYKCDLCGSSFRVKAYLTAHVQKVHLKLKKFKCSIENCSASFVHRELLNYHVRKHLNIRNFSCRYCGKTFVTRSCCNIHERIHTDERPYNCNFCDRTFIHHSDHRRHQLKHQSDNLFKTETSLL